MAEIQQAAIAAANWWTNQLAKPTLNSFKICNNSTSGYLMTLASLSNAKSHLATKELLKDFCDELSKQIDLELSRTSAVYLSCDTSPCYILLGVADLVGVKIAYFHITEICGLHLHLFEYKMVMELTSCEFSYMSSKTI